MLVKESHRDFIEFVWKVSEGFKISNGTSVQNFGPHFKTIYGYLSLFDDENFPSELHEAQTFKEDKRKLLNQHWNGIKTFPVSPSKSPKFRSRVAAFFSWLVHDNENMPRVTLSHHRLDGGIDVEGFYRILTKQIDKARANTQIEENKENLQLPEFSFNIPLPKPILIIPKNGRRIQNPAKKAVGETAKTDKTSAKSNSTPEEDLDQLKKNKRDESVNKPLEKRVVDVSRLPDSNPLFLGSKPNQSLEL